MKWHQPWRGNCWSLRCIHRSSLCFSLYFYIGLNFSIIKVKREKETVRLQAPPCHLPTWWLHKGLFTSPGLSSSPSNREENFQGKVRQRCSEVSSVVKGQGLWNFGCRLSKLCNERLDQDFRVLLQPVCLTPSPWSACKGQGLWEWTVWTQKDPCPGQAMASLATPQCSGEFCTPSKRAWAVMAESGKTEPPSRQKVVQSFPISWVTGAPASKVAISTVISGWKLSISKLCTGHN